MNEFDSKIYKVSRQAYIWQCTFDYFITLLITDAFLAKLLANIGISDSVIGIISSLISFAFLFQLLTVFAVGKITNAKGISIVFELASSLLFMSLYLLPFINVSTGLKTVIVIAVITLAYFCKYFVATILFKWANSFVDPGKRASYSASKEMVSLATGMVFTFAVGYIIDRFEALDNMSGGFIFIAISMLVLSVCNFVSLSLIKGKKEEKQKSTPFKEVMENTFGNEGFKSIILVSIIQNVATYMTVGFLGIYKTKDLLITVGAVQIINIVANAFRFVFSMPIGKYSNKKGFIKGAQLGFVLMAMAFLTVVFCTKNTWWLIVAYTILHSVGVAGTNQNMLNITYSYVNKKYFVQASAIKNSIGGIIGFLASIVAGKILDIIQSNNNMIFGIKINAQQFLALISFVLMSFLVVYIERVVSKMETLKQ